MIGNPGTLQRWRSQESRMSLPEHRNNKKVFLNWTLVIKDQRLMSLVGLYGPGEAKVMLRTHITIGKEGMPVEVGAGPHQIIGDDVGVGVVLLDGTVGGVIHAAAHQDGDGAGVSHLAGKRVAEVTVQEVGNGETKIAMIAVEGEVEGVTAVEVLLYVLISPEGVAKEAMFVDLRIQNLPMILVLKGDMIGVEVVEDEGVD